MKKIKDKKPFGHRTRTVNYDDVTEVQGDYAGLANQGFLHKMVHEKGFFPLLCCGTCVEDQIIAIYHPARVRVGNTITCPRCQAVHTVRELRHPDPVLEGARFVYLRQDGTYVIPGGETRLPAAEPN